MEVHGSKSLIDRAKAILLSPKDEWVSIETEKADTAQLFITYAIPLAAIGPVAQMIGGQIFGIGAFGISYHPSLLSSISMAVSGFILNLIGIFVLGLIINSLAPTFNGTKDQNQALKVAVYSATASWVAGIFQILPMISFLGILGLYSFYLMYLGLPRLMKYPEDKALTYTIVVAIAAIVVWLIIGSITARTTGLFGGGPASSIAAASGDDGEISGSVTIPGLGKIDVGEMEQATKDMEHNAKAEPVDKDVLKAMLPTTIAGFNRTSLEASSSQAGGIGGSMVNAEYEQGTNHIELSVVDLAGAGAFAGMASAMNVEIDREDDDGYERVHQIDGRMVQEKWSKGSHSGEYGIMIGKRFMVRAEGNATSLDAHKALIAALPLDKLENLARN